MGLDMYAHRVKKEEIAYWRKHNRLQGWFEQEYYKAHSDATEFNCTDLYVTVEMLDRLELDINEDALPKTEGFFYGTDSYSWEERKDMKNYDLDFITTARKALSEGDHIVYSCWW